MMGKRADLESYEREMICELQKTKMTLLDQQKQLKSTRILQNRSNMARNTKLKEIFHTEESYRGNNRRSKLDQVLLDV